MGSAKRDADLMSTRAAIFAAVLATTVAPLPGWASSPSFDCGKASTPDEFAICSDDHLAELDRLYARDFAIQKAKDRKLAIEGAAIFLKSRRLCGNDRYCITERMEYLSGGTPKPYWLDDAYKARLAKEVTNDDLTAKSLAAVGVTGSFTTSSKDIQATLRSINGLDTSHAVAEANFTVADAREYCERDPGGETFQNGGKLSVQGCVAMELRNVRNMRETSKADCPRKVVAYGGQRWTVLKVNEGRLVWNTPDGEMESSGPTTAFDSQFELLCPNTHARLRVQVSASAVASAEPQAQPITQPANDGAAAIIREALARDLSTVLTGNDKAGDERKYMTPDLFGRFDKGAQDFDADWYLGLQDTSGFKLTDLTSVPVDPSHTIVAVSFSVDRQPIPFKFAYHMVRVGDRWLIDDIDYLNQKTTARGLLAKAN